jgi:hypothetical protein
MAERRKPPNDGRTCVRCWRDSANVGGTKMCGPCAGDWQCNCRSWPKSSRRGIETFCYECKTKKPDTKVCKYCRHNKSVRIPSCYDCCDRCVDEATVDLGRKPTVFGFEEMLWLRQERRKRIKELWG